jgi:hypothetical protein
MILHVLIAMVAGWLQRQVVYLCAADNSTASRIQ